jgi:Spy/CpxP family protein refolding chaperone
MPSSSVRALQRSSSGPAQAVANCERLTSRHQGSFEKTCNLSGFALLHPVSSKILPMKHAILLPLAAIIGVAALVISQLAAADPNPTSSPQESPTAKGPPPPGDPQKFCESNQFGGPRDRFHGPGRHWARHREHGAEEQTLDRLLNLTEEQKEKVKEIMAANRPKIKAIREEQSVKIQAVMEDARKQIRPLLTPAQQKVFDDAQQLRENARKLKEEARQLRQDKGSDQSE